MSGKRLCDHCGREFRFEDTAKKDVWGNLYAVPGGYYPPFKCSRCGGVFCAEHRLPENHNCTNMRNQETPIEIDGDIRTNEKSISYSSNYGSNLIHGIAKKIAIIIAYSAFSIVTALPVLFNLMVLTMKGTVPLLYTFAPLDLTLYVAIILAYTIFWAFTSYTIMRGRCRKKYHLVLLVISIANLWVFFMLVRASVWLSVFSGF